MSPFCTSATCTCLESSSALLLPIPLPPKEQRTASPSPLPPSAATCGDPGATGRFLLLPPRQLSYSIGLGASSQRALGCHPVPGMYSRDIHAPAESPPCWLWAAEHGGEEESTAGTALCCRESPACRRPAQVCYGALTSAKPTGGESKRAHNGPAKARPLCPETAPLHLRAPHPGLCRGGGNKLGGLRLSKDGGVGTPGVKTVPCGPQGCARAGLGWGHARGRRPVALARGSRQLHADRSFLLLLATGLERGPARPGTPLCRRCGALARREGWGAGAELLPRKEGWCGGKVGRYNTNIQVIAVEGKEGVSGGI
ncbi:uncharacterized protein LOC121068629 [Cygnus olor]|uniref:uncharacterized protein LOC121068629 n=1 Tax=Cygnus olor TaxID=8869 RepID=UPI001ADDEE5E|nr:uncharacterized protein LOC121068629 [Cygnus olor]